METFTGYDELIADVQAELLSRDLATSTATTILAAFSQLKDAVGVVRAFVAAALVMPPESLATLSGRMRGTLIVCVHRQRACGRDDPRLCASKAAQPRRRRLRCARALVAHHTPFFSIDSFRLRRAPPPTATTHPFGFSVPCVHTELPNEIALVQRALESDLSVSAVLEHLTVDNWWALASNHIDKLHSLQQTLLVEYERSARRMQRSGGLSRGVSMHSGGDFPMGPGRSPSGGRIGGGDRWGSGILDLGVFQSGHHNNSNNHRNSERPEQFRRQDEPACDVEGLELLELGAGLRRSGE